MDELTATPPSQSRAERQRLRQHAKAAEDRRRRWRKRLRRGARLAVIAGVVAAPLGGIAWWLGTRTLLPPTTMENHVEVNPPAHILTEPMPVEIQKHMLEHADGSGPPGVIIQFNCKKYACPGDLVAKLTAVAKDYPGNVYLAPNPVMDARIALTRLGRILVLEEFDADRIRRFILN
jgi:hypothetical protein